jgi:hypothetical protein
METNSDRNDEIDLRVIYHSIKDVFSRIWNYLVSLFSIATRRWKLVTFFLLLGSGAGIGLFWITRPTYISTLTLASNLLTNDFCSDIVQELELIIEDDSPALLAQKLKIDPNSAKEIKRIEFYNYDEKLKEKYKDKDTVVLGRPFKIKVHASRNTVFDTLQQALVNYLENNPYALKRKEIKKQENVLMREKLSNEIKQLDSLKNVVAGNLLPRGTQSGFVFGQPIDPVTIYREGISFFQKQLDLTKEMVLIDNIQVITDFSARIKPDSPKLSKMITAGGAAGLLFGILFAFILDKRKKV